jgi:hypothetical protein
VKLSVLGVAIALLGGPVVAADTLEDTFQSLKDAVAKKDAAEVKKLAVETHTLATDVLCKPKPESADDIEIWKNNIDYAKAADLYIEFALYSTAVQSPAAAMVDLLSALEEQNAKSKYLDEAYGPYLLALNQTGAGAKIPAHAEKALANLPENEDLLVFLADYSYSHKQGDRALAYANRLTATLNKRAKPEALSAAEWERKRTAGLARGYWIAGVVSGERNQYAAADRNLRAALPLVKGNAAMAGPALFYLGFANYQLGKMTLNRARVIEGQKFSEQAAAIAGPFADQAWKNAMIMKTEAGNMR